MQSSNFRLENNIYTIDELLYKFNTVTKSKTNYINVAASFDIETSSFYDNNEKRAIMYIWVLGINGRVTIGRTWKEFMEAYYKIVAYYNTNINNRFIIYIHNLSYEFQWIRKKFNWHKVFSLDNRKPIYAVTKEGIEFRCSYILSNLSLLKVGENLVKYKVNKMKGDLDYRKIRTPLTSMTKKELGYVINDGLVVMAYIQELIEEYEITGIPYTNTGFVRNFCRNKCLKEENRQSYNKLMRELTITENEYTTAKKAFRGGFTHANPQHVGRTQRNVASFDFTSSYPAVMLSEPFPMSRGIEYIPKDTNDFYEKLNKYCCILDVGFENITSTIVFDNFISKHKCTHIENYILNNGRVVLADALRLCCTNIDFSVITKTYKWTHLKLYKMYIYKKGFLPKKIIESILEFYEDKTTLKDVEGKEAEYLRKKGMLNSIYGMCVTDICRDDFVYDEEWKVEHADLSQQIARYNSSNTRFLSYMWGIFVTSYASRNLWSGILECKEDYIYSDTDSLKILNYEKHSDYFNKYNENISKKIKNCLRFYDLDISKMEPKNKKGKSKPIGVWDYEGTYDMFKTLGAKRYIFYKDNKLQITISGVSKNNGCEYLLYKYKDIEKIFENFTDNLKFPAEYNIGNKIFPGTGKLTHSYIDFETEGDVIDFKGIPYHYKEDSSTHMEPVGYSLSLDDMFIRYLSTINNEFIY